MTEDEEKRFSPIASFSKEFKDSETSAAGIPGGKFDIFPAKGKSFQGTVRRVNLAGGVSVRTVALSEPIAMRSEMIGGSTPTITYMFTLTHQPKAAVDGIHLAETAVFSRGHGDTPSPKTGGPFEVAANRCVAHRQH